MLEGIIKAFAIPEVRKRAIFTLGAIIVFRLGAWIPVPGVDTEALKTFFRGLGGIFQFLNMFTGGALERLSLFAMGVIPYINASIILSLLVPIIPKLKELQQQGEEGRKVINRITRYATVGLAILEALGTSFMIVSQGLLRPEQSVIGFYLTSIVALTTGTMFLMWLGERITENGIGRGISMIIMVGIIADYPRYIGDIITRMSAGTTPVFWAIPLAVVFVIVIAGVVIIQLGARRLDIQYAKRIVRGRVYGGQSTYIPLGVNQGGVIPIIFASALLTLPATFIQFMGLRDRTSGVLNWIMQDLQRGGALYLTLYALLIIFFTYFYSAIVFDPKDLAENLRKWGGFIPGLRPGKPTGDYIEKIQNRILLIGALFLTAIALLPYIIMGMSGLATVFFIGGTSILIVVGVGVDTLKQIEAHMLERYYESFIEKGGVWGRRM